MKKKELILLCKEMGIKGISSKRKIEIESILKTNKIQEMSMKSLDTKDPISLEPFQDWELSELFDAIFVNQYFYKTSSIDAYINSVSSHSYRDPINPTLCIPETIVQKYCKEKEKKVSIEIIYDMFTKDNFNFYFLILSLSSDKFIKTRLPTKIIFGKCYILIGIFPSDISIENDTLKSLDVSSTSECILFKIMELYTSEKMIESKQNYIEIKSIPSLPICHLNWIHNNSIDTISPHSLYMKLLKNLDEVL